MRMEPFSWREMAPPEHVSVHQQGLVPGGVRVVLGNDVLFLRQVGEGAVPVKHVQVEHGHVQAVVTAHGKSVARFEFMLFGGFPVFFLIVPAFILKDIVHVLDLFPPANLFSVDVQVVIAFFRVGVK